MSGETHVLIPVGRDEGSIVNATMYLPVPMTPAQWDQMLSTLEAMKPVLCPPLVGGKSLFTEAS
jgi:hypothetical protein